MRVFIAFLPIFSASTAVHAQVQILGREDKTEVVYSVNQPDGLASARTRAEEKGGSWSLVLQSAICGHGAIWYASNGEERKYFVVVGKESTADANTEAAATARNYAKGRAGWHAGIMRVFVNENRYSLKPSLATGVVERWAGLDPCTKSDRKGGAVGVRG